MELSDLPVLVLNKIFRYLPLDDLMRMRRLNNKFYQISTSVIGETKILNLNDKIFVHLFDNPDLFVYFFELCSHNVESIIVSCPAPSLRNELSTIQEIFSDFSCPRLIEIHFRRFLLRDRFHQILRNNPNLKILRIDGWVDDDDDDDENFSFPSDAPVGEKVEKFRIDSECSEDFLRGLIDQFPNLKSFKTFIDMEIDMNKNIFEHFCRTHPKLECFTGNFTDDNRLENSRYFWQLESLRSLNLQFWLKNEIQVPLLTKISDSFPNLERLKILEDTETNWGIASLGNLKKLKKLQLSIMSTDEIDLDWNLMRLAIGCTKLRIVHLDLLDSTSESMKSFVRFCPHLERLELFRVKNVKTLDEAIETVENFAVIAGRKIDIVVYDDNNDIWTSDDVATAATEFGFDGQQVISFLGSENCYYEFDHVLKESIDDEDD